MGCNGNEMTAKLHFYIQDFIGGRNETVYEVARASITSTSPTSFGLVQVLDDVMTAGPDMNSKPLGRFQGVLRRFRSENNSVHLGSRRGRAA
ncbi:UNVERIFIED_CONTAM: Dirigent protein 21 [Sesamum calycinum]|uniref:Dirigent protein n=1 Tax=Sesamum calycinum TaxID=2727403 RepID=A0AAW2NJI3_9LAMI